MSKCRRPFRFDPSILTAKVLGTLTFAFCLGTAIGLFMPAAFIAVAETCLLVLLAYFCLFRW